jgi:hypothetical protein
MLYNDIIGICRDVIGPAAPMFLDSVLRDLNLKKDSITHEDLRRIADNAYEKTSKYTGLMRPINDDIKKAILDLGR